MPSKMRAWVINKTGDILEEKRLLELIELEIPRPKSTEILIKVSAAGICHTELDEIEGRTPPPELPVIPGHQVVGTVVECGSDAKKFEKGEKAAVAWIGWTCGKCEKCRAGHENLCQEFIATGRDLYGGYAEYMVADENFAYKVPEHLTDEQIAPMLCAGAVGYRSLRLTGIKSGEPLGFTGFGASAHLVLKMAKRLYPGSRFYVFARSAKERDFAKELGAEWAGDAADQPPVKLRAIIDTTPVWKTVLCALENLQPGGRLVINAIRKENSDKSQLMLIDYGKHLWLEKEIKTVANVSRKDVEEFLKLSVKLDIRPEVELFHLEDALTALKQIKQGDVRGAKVLTLS